MDWPEQGVAFVRFRGRRGMVWSRWMWAMVGQAGFVVFAALWEWKVGRAYLGMGCAETVLVLCA